MKLHMHSSYKEGRSACGARIHAEWKVCRDVFKVLGAHGVRPGALLCRKCIRAYNYRALIPIRP